MSETDKSLIIWEDRPLSNQEIELVRWLLENAYKDARNYLPQIGKLRVISRCGCGCASVDFKFDGVAPNRKSGMDVLSDYYWGTGGKDLCGIFVFARDEKLAGLEVYSVDGLVTTSELPNISDLREFSDPSHSLA